MRIPPHSLIVKDYGFLTGFTLIGNYKDPVLCVFLDDFSHACPVLPSESFVHAVFHHIEEIIQYGCVVCDAIVIVQPSYNNNYGLRRGSQPRLFPSQSRSC